jgi:hypothetical protein
MTSLVLDVGGLIAIERGDRRLLVALDEAMKKKASLVVPAAAMAQAWRDGTRQVRLVRFLGLPEVEVLSLTRLDAARVGELLRVSRTSDVVDAAVVVAARERRAMVVTSDPEDLFALDPTLRVFRV